MFVKYVQDHIHAIWAIGWGMLGHDSFLNMKQLSSLASCVTEPDRIRPENGQLAYFFFYFSIYVCIVCRHIGSYKCHMGHQVGHVRPQRS